MLSKNRKEKTEVPRGVGLFLIFAYLKCLPLSVTDLVM